MTRHWRGGGATARHGDARRERPDEHGSESLGSPTRGGPRSRGLAAQVAGSRMETSPGNIVDMAGTGAIIRNASQDPPRPAVPLGADGSDADRDGRGRFVPGNTANMVVGERSRRFWHEHELVRQEIRLGILTDQGHTPDDAPRALVVAADGMAQAQILRDAAYDRLVEVGGPLTSHGRARRAFTVWLAAADRVERHVRLVGLRRVPRPAPSLHEVLEGDDA